MRRLAATVTVAIVSTGSLTACGGDEYCGKLQDYDKDTGLAQANFRTRTGLEKLYDVFVDLGKSAPDGLADDYKLVTEGVRATKDGRAEIDRKAVAAAYSAISDDARDRCDVDMG
jgi:hypothetical protein